MHSEALKRRIYCKNFTLTIVNGIVHQHRNYLKSGNFHVEIIHVVNIHVDLFQFEEAENDASVATSSEQLESISSWTIEKVDNSTGDECIACVKNPLYLSHHKAISINNNATSLLDGVSSSDSLIVSIKF